MALPFPQQGRPMAEIMADLWRRAGALDHYQDHHILGFPGTYPPTIALDAMTLFTRFNPNNIMSHTHLSPSTGAAPTTEGERGAFAATQELERQVVYMAGSLLGGDLAGPVDQALDGYLASGGSEANIMGLWVGRNQLLAGEHVGQRGVRPAKIRVIAPLSAHYSIRKACDLLGLGEGSWLDCPEGDACPTLRTLRAEGGVPSQASASTTDTLLQHRFVPNADGSGLVFADLDDRYRVKPADVAVKIDEALAQGITRFILVATAGTTMTGAFDPIAELSDLIQQKEGDGSGAQFYFHVDAAFGGLVAPFLKTPPAFDFRIARVDSMAIDPQKMGMVPYPAGLFLCRKGRQESIARAVAYIASHRDDTLLGSRPGSAAAACWAVFSHFGRQGCTDGKDEVPGFEQIVATCMEHTHYLAAELAKVGAEVFTPTVNILAAAFDEQEYEPKTLRAIADRYRVVPELFSDAGTACPRRVYRFTLMPHVRRATIDDFVAALAAVRRQRVHPSGPATSPA